MGSLGEPGKAMTKERKFKPFDEGWSQKKKLCYDLFCSVTGTLGYVQLMVKPDRKLSQRTLQGVSKRALINAEGAARRVAVLYAIICTEEREAKERPRRSKK
jgi:hypothetical protein